MSRTQCANNEVEVLGPTTKGQYGLDSPLLAWAPHPQDPDNEVSEQPGTSQDKGAGALENK